MRCGTQPGGSASPGALSEKGITGRSDDSGGTAAATGTIGSQGDSASAPARRSQDRRDAAPRTSGKSVDISMRAR